MSMNKAKKAALYSALVFPGAGFLWLKNYTRAAIFIVPSLLALWHLFSTLYRSIAPTYMKMLSDAREGLIDISDFGSLYAKLHHEIYHSLSTQIETLNAALAILIAAWFLSIISSYFVGKKMDAEGASNTTATSSDL